jgi:hypothetical protein
MPVMIRVVVFEKDARIPTFDKFCARGAQGDIIRVQFRHAGGCPKARTESSLTSGRGIVLDMLLVGDGIIEQDGARPQPIS